MKGARLKQGVLALIVWAALASGAATSFREAASLATLARSADVVAIGKVTRVSANRYSLATLEVLKGTLPAGDLTIVRPQIPATEPRWAPYAPGQVLAVFVIRNPDGTWRLAGLSVDGELPLDEHYVYLVGHFVDGLAVARFETLGTTIASQRTSRTTFEDAVSEYVRCFAPSAAKGTRACPKVADYAARSPLHAKFASEIPAR